jgi:hypothetical protein
MDLASFLRNCGRLVEARQHLEVALKLNTRTLLLMEHI